MILPHSLRCPLRKAIQGSRSLLRQRIALLLKRIDINGASRVPSPLDQPERIDPCPNENGDGGQETGQRLVLKHGMIREREGLGVIVMRTADNPSVAIIALPNGVSNQGIPGRPVHGRERLKIGVFAGADRFPEGETADREWRPPVVFDLSNVSHPLFRRPAFSTGLQVRNRRLLVFFLVHTMLVCAATQNMSLGGRFF